jgi:hypothetical protein
LEDKKNKYKTVFFGILFFILIGCFYHFNMQLKKERDAESIKRDYAFIQEEEQKEIKEAEEKENEKNEFPRIIEVGDVIDDTGVIFSGFSDKESTVVVLTNVNDKTPHFYNIKKENPIRIDGTLFEFGEKNEKNKLQIISTKK